jgi:hypothetical protein
MAMRRIFWGFCINQFGIGPFRFGLRIRGDIRNRKTTPRPGDSPSRGIGDFPTHRVGESPTRRVVLPLRISPRIRSRNRNGSKGIYEEPISAKKPQKIRLIAMSL